MYIQLVCQLGKLVTTSISILCQRGGLWWVVLITVTGAFCPAGGRSATVWEDISSPNRGSDSELSDPLNPQSSKAPPRSIPFRVVCSESLTTKTSMTGTYTRSFPGRAPLSTTSYFWQRERFVIRSCEETGGLSPFFLIRLLDPARCTHR